MTALLHAPSPERRAVRSLRIRTLAAATVTYMPVLSWAQRRAGCEPEAQPQPLMLPEPLMPNLRPKG